MKVSEAEIAVDLDFNVPGLLWVPGACSSLQSLYEGRPKRL